MAGQMGDGEIWQLADARGVGGIERHVVELVGALGTHGIAARAVVYAPYRPSEYRDLLAATRTPSLELGGGAASLLRALRTHRPALLHTHGYKAGIVGRLCARAAGVPVVSTFHAGERAPLPVGLYQAIDGATSILGQRIAVSQPIAARLPWRSTVIGNFVAPSRAAVAELPRRVAFVGRLSPEKAPDLFCEIARRVGQSMGPSVHWDIYGDGPMRGALESIAPDWVRFHGFAADMDKVWPQVGLLLMPSRAEGLPMAALEAMARGIPVAASAVGALPELLAPAEGDWTFAVGDIDAAVATTRAWHDLPTAALERLRGELVDVVCRQYSPAAVLPRLLAVYRAAGWRAAASSSSTVQSSASSGAA